MAKLRIMNEKSVKIREICGLTKFFKHWKKMANGRFLNS